MSVLFGRFIRYAARKAAHTIASNPEARQKAVNTGRTVLNEAKGIAREKDRARAAGRSVRRVINSFQNGDGTDRSGGTDQTGGGSDEKTGGTRSGS